MFGGNKPDSGVLVSRSLKPGYEILPPQIELPDNKGLMHEYLYGNEALHGKRPIPSNHNETLVRDR